MIQKHSLQSYQSKQKKSTQLLYDPDTGFSLLQQKHMQVDFIINQQKQRNDIIVKILLAKQKQCIKIQLLSQTDLFFYYQIMINHGDVQDLSNKFQIQLKDVMDLAFMLNKNMQEVEKGDKKLVFQVSNENIIEMSITRVINHKIFLVFLLKLTKLSTFQSNQLAAYRYGSLRQEIAEFQLKIKDLKDIIKAKNPYMLSFINKL